ncbi:MAG: carboxypeptidase-like regulatory domain-containing protein [Thermoplasmatota archaeon]
MKGKARCPHCRQNVVVEVPDGASGEQVTTCPQCGMEFRVNVDEQYSWEAETPPIHPSVHLDKHSWKPVVAGVILIVICLLGMMIAGALLFSLDTLTDTGMASTYTGTVVDEEGSKLAGVNVTVEDTGMTATTDGAGAFTLSNISGGKHTLVFTSAGYKTLRAEVFVLPWDITLPAQDFTMEQGTGSTSQRGLMLVVLDLAPVLAVGILALSIVALVGGILALLRKHFVIAVVGAVCGIIAGFFSIVGIPLGIVALVLLLISREEFVPAGSTEYSF